jgi:hypothetical protein
MRKLITLAILIFSAGSPQLASGQTFQFSAKELVERLDKQLVADNGDTTKQCRKSSQDTICSFNDVGFQKSVVRLKKLNLANGTFFLKESIIIREDGGKVSTILLTGDRGDPPNLFHFSGLLGSLIKTLGPSLSTDDIVKEALALGIMRGDDDPTIGQPKHDIQDFAEIVCNSHNSRESTKVGCAFFPRF